MSKETQKIEPCLWFDDQAEEAARFYTSLFPNSKQGSIVRYGKEGQEIHGKPEGAVMTVQFELAGYKMVGLNGGPLFRFSPAVSFFVVCETEEEIDGLWEALSEGGTVLMELQKYDWSEKYGWVTDRYGLSWQVSLGKLEDVGDKISPFLTFVGDQYGRAEEAVEFYTSLFKDSEIAGILRREANAGPDKEGTVLHAQFRLNGQTFMVSESGFEHPFTFNESVSLQVHCETQEEVDEFWEKLSEGGDQEAQQCGWLKDKFGVSWQVIPEGLIELVSDPNSEKSQRAMRALLQMKKTDINALRKAYDGE